MPITASSITRSSPVWCADYLSRDHLIPAPAKLDAAQFRTTDGVLVTVTTAAAQGATSITVAALSGPIPSGTVIDFGAAKFARLTAAAVAGATTLTVAALPTALAGNETATYIGTTAVKYIKSGTLVGRTFTERDAGTGFGPAASSDDEIYLLAFDVIDAADNADCELVRHNTVVKENFLPNWSTLGTTAQGLIRARYRCITGRD